MDTNFIDLDILLSRVKEPKSKEYFLEALKAYKAGALRASLSSAWVAVAYDLIAKFRELSANGDASSQNFLKSWDNATAKRDTTKLLALEATIVKHAADTAQAINKTSEIHLERLRQDRHLCAHPAFSSEADLFEPSAELVRLHLVNAIDLVLSQHPLQGKAVFEIFGKDVASAGFPQEPRRIRDYVESRYLKQLREGAVSSFGVVLAKSIVRRIPLEWEPHYKKVAASLEAIKDRCPSQWPTVRDSVVKLIDSTDPELRLRAIALLAIVPEAWTNLHETTKTALTHTLEHVDVTTLTDFSFLRAIRLRQFQPSITRIVSFLSNEQLQKAIALDPLLEVWEPALLAYSNSSSFRISEANFRSLIMPFAKQVRSRHTASLIVAVKDNNQNWDAADTPNLLANFFQEVSIFNLPDYDVRSDIHMFLCERHRHELYKELWDAWKLDGWNPPMNETYPDDIRL